MSTSILRVALPVPRRRLFDYLPPQRPEQSLRPGMRLLVPFGRGRRIGILLGTAATSELPRQRLRRVLAPLDKTPLLDTAQLRLLEWGSRYYQYPIGEVVFGALPALLRTNAAPLPEAEYWRITAAPPAARRLSPRMRELLETLRRTPEGLDTARLEGRGRRTLEALARRGLARRGAAPLGTPRQAVPRPGPRLNQAQRTVVNTLLAELGRPRPRRFLLEGITGSGKTEVYLRVVEEVARRGRQALVLLPEIALTPQQLKHFQERPGSLRRAAAFGIGRSAPGSATGAPRAAAKPP